MRGHNKLLAAVAAVLMALPLASPAFAANNQDTAFTFLFNEGRPKRTEWRSKQDASNVYMNVQTIEGSFTAHIVGSDYNTNAGPGADCSHGYTYSVSNTGVYRMRNWVFDGSHRYYFAAIYANPSYSHSYKARGLWSPDSV